MTRPKASAAKRAATRVRHPQGSFPSLDCLLFALPLELQRYIITLACRSPPSNDNKEAIEKRSRTALDVSTTMSLCLTSRAVQAIAYGVLYQSVTLARPSALLQFYQALLARPSLCKLVKNLHIGPTSDLKGEHPVGVWPFICKEEGGELTPEGEPLLWIFSSLEEEQLPAWCHPHRVWAWDRSENHCQGQAVFDALQTALKTLDVEPYRRGYGQSGRYIGVDAWALRCLQLEAALSLFLGEMKRIEVENKYSIRPHAELKRSWPLLHPTDCPGLRCQHYTRLAIVVDPEEHVAPIVRGGRALKIFKLTRQQLLRHIGRPGAVADQFNHPAVFARERHQGGMNGYGMARLDVDLGGKFPNHFNGPEGAADEEGEPEISPLDQAPSPQDLAAAAEPELQTRASLVHLGARVLSMVAPHIINLSLSGCLYIALCGDTEPFIHLKELRCLSVGPLLRYWDSDLFSSRGVSMPQLQHVRFCTRVLTVSEADSLAGRNGALPKLKRVDLEVLRHEKPCDNLATPPSVLFKTVCSLQGLQCVLSANDEVEQDNASKAPVPAPPRFMEVKVHQTMQRNVLELAPSEAVREAWDKGEPLPTAEDDSCNYHIIHLTESEAAGTHLFPSAGITRMYEASQKWWEEYAIKGKVPERSFKQPPPKGTDEAMKMYKEMKASGEVKEGEGCLFALVDGKVKKIMIKKGSFED